MNKEDFFIWLEEFYGLDTVLEQNDIESWEVLQMLYEQGKIDLEDYFPVAVVDEELLENED